MNGSTPSYVGPWHPAETAENYVVAARDEIVGGKPVTVAASRAYGCSIKYNGM